MLCKRLGAEVHRIGTAVGVAVALGLSACTTQSNSSVNTNAATSIRSTPDPQSRPLVVATNSVLCDLTQKIAAETITLKCLVPGGIDPHEYKTRPEDNKAIEAAQLILYGGYRFEPGFMKLINTTSNPAPKVAVSELAVPKPLLGAAHEHEHEHEAPDAAAAEIPDPHVFHNAENGAKMATVIGQALTQLNPSHTSVYTANTQIVVQELNQIHAWIKTSIATIPAAQRKLITTHDALGYYADAYGISIEGALEGVSTEERPTPARVKALVKTIRQTNVPTIFPEATVSPKLIQTVAKEAGVKIAPQTLYTDGLGEPGSVAGTYSKMLVANTQTIVEGLGGKFTPFPSK